MAKITNPLAPTITRLTSTGTTTGYFFTVTSANATVGATYTNNGNTFTVLSTISAGTQLFCSGALAPTASGTLTKATGTGDATITFSANQAMATYTTPANAVRLKIRQVAGGGGGGGGTAGGFTLFGTALFICGGGSNGATAQTAGAGGTPTVGTLPSGATAFSLNGGGGGMGAQNTQDTYGVGGSSAFGGGGSSVSNGAPNTGGGGGGGPVRGGGGGAGSYIEGTIPNPVATYYYAVALGGTAGSGFAGATGQIIIEEQYS